MLKESRFPARRVRKGAGPARIDFSDGNQLGFLRISREVSLRISLYFQNFGLIFNRKHTEPPGFAGFLFFVRQGQK